MEINRQKTINLIQTFLSKTFEISNKDELLDNLSKESDENLIKIQKEIVSFAKNDKIESKSFINKLNKIKNNFDEEVEKRVELLKEEKK